VETAPVKSLSPGVWLADGSVPLHDLQAILNERPQGADREAEAPPEVRFPEEGDYETLGGFVTAQAGRVPPLGAVVTWDGLTFTVRAGDERRVAKVEIARRGHPEAGAAEGVAGAAAALRG